MEDYSSLEYWEKRYLEQQDIFEWYLVYDNLQEKIGEMLKPEDKILNVGAGTSKDLYLQEIKDVTNIDFSQTAISIMEEKYKDQNIEMKYIKMNVTDMSPFPDEEFNVVIDKATLDSVICGENALPIVDKMINEIFRVLKPGGIYISISHADEQNRKQLFSEEKWEYSMIPIENKIFVMDEKDTKNYHKVYVLTKKHIPVSIPDKPAQ